MSFTNDFPYTDFHELNLDWILNKIKEFQERIDSFEDTVLKKQTLILIVRFLNFHRKLVQNLLILLKKLQIKLLISTVIINNL